MASSGALRFECPVLVWMQTQEIDVQTTTLTVIEGGRRQLESDLLAEFLRPGVGNLRRVRRMGKALRARGALRPVAKR